MTQLTTNQHVDVFTADSISTPPAGGAGLTLMMPTSRAGQDNRAKGIRLRNLLDEATELLQTTGGLSKSDAEKILAPLRSLVDDLQFWMQQADSLVIFADSTRTDVFRLAADLPEKVYVGSKWDLVPVISELTGDHHFHLLAFSQNSVRLFETDGTRIAELDRGNIPASEEEVFDDTDHQSHLQYSGQGTGKVNFHGHGGDAKAEQIQLERFLRVVATELEKRIPVASRLPLLLAAVSENATLMRQILNWTPIVETTVEGSADKLTPGELVERSQPAIDSWNASADEGYAATIDDARSSGRAIFDPVEIAGMASQGRIAAVFGDRSAINLESPASDADYDRINAILADTLANGGEAHQTPPGVSEPIIAVARY